MGLRFSGRKKSRLAKKRFPTFKLETRKLRPLYARLRSKNPSALSTASRFSSWDTAVGVVSYLKRPFKKNKPRTVTTTVAERQNAEMLILKEVQRTAFEDEITRLSRQEGNRKLVKNSPLLKLDPFLDDTGLLRVGGRLEKSSLPFEVKHPIILPRSSQVTNLIIDHFHKKVKHQGKGITMNEIRSNGLWILNLSAAVSSQIHKCVKCRRQRRPTEGQRWLISRKRERSPPLLLHIVEWIASDRSTSEKDVKI